VQTQQQEEMTPGEYMLLHDCCAVCHWPAQRRGRWMELHHIVGGSGRKDAEINYICLCCRCHHAVHNKLPDGYGEIPKGAVLAAKLEADGAVDESGLAALRGRKALPYDICPIPDPYLEDRHRNGGIPWP